jgi:hypothetical protein
VKSAKENTENLSNDELNIKINEYLFSEKDIEDIHMKNKTSFEEFYYNDDDMINYLYLTREKRKRE